jgi:hypothetical protein
METSKEDEISCGIYDPQDSESAMGKKNLTKLTSAQNCSCNEIILHDHHSSGQSAPSQTSSTCNQNISFNK